MLRRSTTPRRSQLAARICQVSRDIISVTIWEYDFALIEEGATSSNLSEKSPFAWFAERARRKSGSRTRRQLPFPFSSLYLVLWWRSAHSFESNWHIIISVTSLLASWNPLFVGYDLVLKGHIVTARPRRSFKQTYSAVFSPLELPFPEDRVICTLVTHRPWLHREIGGSLHLRSRTDFIAPQSWYLVDQTDDAYRTWNR